MPSKDFPLLQRTIDHRSYPLVGGHFFGWVVPLVVRGRMHNQVGELEALLICALGLENNFAKMRLPGAKPWAQVKAHEVDAYLDKVARRLAPLV